jgi:hypothetical protein
VLLFFEYGGRTLFAAKNVVQLVHRQGAQHEGKQIVAWQRPFFNR